MDYKYKYLKYKKKYLLLKAGYNKITHLSTQENKEIPSPEVINNCVKSLIQLSYMMYKDLLEDYNEINKSPITLVSCGQSPAYCSLAMMNFNIYDPSKVNIVIMPFSSYISDNEVNKEEIMSNYCKRLEENNVKLNKFVIIIDKIASGKGIKSLENTLKKCFKGINIFRKISVNEFKVQLFSSLFISDNDMSKANDPEIRQKVEAKMKEENVDQYIIPCEQYFSNTFPRLIPEYKPSNFNNKIQFRNAYLLNPNNSEQTYYTLNNQLADMIIDISKNYNGNIKDIINNEWYKKQIE
jgi:lysine/ornithine N-monooxygenase